jgi:hypothetical protein
MPKPKPAPVISHPTLVEHPSAVKAGEGEAEAYALTVGTFWGERRLHLFRSSDGIGTARWVCHPVSRHADDLWTGRAATANDAVTACCRRLAV